MIKKILIVVLLTLATAAAAAKAATPVATYVGAYADPPVWSQANQLIGPLHSDKVFYGPTQALPTSWPSSNYGVTPGALIVLAYKVPTTNVVQFVRSIPPTQPVTMVWFQEPEPHITSAQYIATFEAQANLIHSVAAPNVTVASDNEAYRYQSQFSSSYGCQYVPPAQYVDRYFVDVYEHADESLANNTGFQRWLTCTSNHGRLRGLAEYGLGDCQGTAFRAQTITSDGAWLRVHMPWLELLNYWWSDDTPNSGLGCSTDWQFTDSQTIVAWKALET